MTHSTPAAETAGVPSQDQMLALLKQARTTIQDLKNAQNEPIAVIGFAGRFPGAETAEALWELLREGQSGLRGVSQGELEAAAVPKSQSADDNYVPIWGGFAEADGFDAAFFGYSPREAELLDPQQRVFLESAWSALEDAGYDSTRLPGAVGVYAGAALNGYLANVVSGAAETDPFHIAMSNLGGMIAARCSYHMDLKGPSVGLQTTCSTGLVAVHNAIRGLRQGECDMALAGAVAVSQPRPAGYMYQAESIAASDGVCRPFDASAEGTIFTNGVGTLVLKRLSRAQEDGDTVHGLILGSAVNNDGADKISLTAPSVSGQAEVLTSALKSAQLDPASIDYIEAHGTATALGDPIEIAALNRVYGPGLEQAGRRIAISSVKGNLGHLDAAAGIAGLFRVLLSLRHGRLTPTANFIAPNPKCGFGDVPFEVLHESRDWRAIPERPRRAAVSAFGIGGTNAHMILQEAPRDDAGGADAKDSTTEDETEAMQLLPLSAETPEALTALKHRLADHLDAVRPDLRDVAHSLQVGRKRMALRTAIVAGDTAAEALRHHTDPEAAMDGAPTLAFVFSGQGSQHLDMARDLYGQEPAFQEAFDACLAHVPAELNLKALLLTGSGQEEDAARLNQTEVTQPALFVVEYALAQLWLSRGIQPKALLGHSIGEYVAATLSGVFSLPDALRVVCARGRLMQACQPGAMLSVMMSEAEAVSALPDGVEIAAINAPRSVVLAGPTQILSEMAVRFDRSGIGCRPLRTSHAFHSTMMEPALAEFAAIVSSVTLSPPQIELLSNVTGEWMTAEQATDPQYWVTHLRQPVRFGAGVAKLMELDNPLLLEVGPGSTLIRLARQQLAKAARVVASLPDAGRDAASAGAHRAATLRALGALWAAGLDPDWSALHHTPRRRISLPTYPFQRTSFWLSPTTSGPPKRKAPGEDIRHWFNQPTWIRQPRLTQQTAHSRVLVLGDLGILSDAPDSVEVLRVQSGDHYTKEGDTYQLNPQARVDFAALFADLAARGWVPDQIVNGFGLGQVARAGAPGLLFESSLALAQALQPLDLRPEVTLLGEGMAAVTGAETLDPGAAMALGLVPVLPQDIPGLKVRALDVMPADRRQLSQSLLSHWASAEQAESPLAALRAGYLWLQDHAATPLEIGKNPQLLRPFQTYLVTGDILQGLGGIYARKLVETLRARVIVVGKGLPEVGDWEAWIAKHDTDDQMSQLITALRGAGEAGTSFAIYSGDPADTQWLQTCLDEAEAALGPIQGVFHTAAMGDTYHCPLEDATGDANRQLFETKLTSLVALRQVLAGRQVKFCLLQSSLSVQVGGLGLATYAAANSYLNAFAEAETDAGATHWQAVEWDVCETGSLGQVERDMLRANLIRPDQLWTATQAVLGQPEIARLMVSPADLVTRIEAARNLHAEPVAPVTTFQARSLDTPYIAPRDDYEIAVAEAMSALLGISEVGATDNFFELGGHSLLAIQIITRLRKTYDVELPIRALLYETPTVEGIASVIRKARQEADQEAEMLASLLDTLEDQTLETTD